MIVQFGRHLDGMQPAPPATTVGEVALGPARALEVLELQLGLARAPPRPGEALLAYRSCLAELDGEARFYHRSFAVDPLGVARTLLAWRARWYEAGWRGSFDGTVSGRLADMADVERLASGRVPPTPGQRLQRVEQALAGGLVTQIERVVLHDETESLPAAWRAVLAHFDCRPAAGLEPAVHASPGTDLWRVQRALLALAAGREGGVPEPAALASDDSLLIVRAVSRDLSAQALGEFLRAIESPDEAVLIAERDGIIVDNALERVGLARAGFRHFSRFRAVSQVLKLCLGLVWEPVSPPLLLQFLLHPVGPLPRWARAVLAEAAAAQPGVGGQAWHKALARVAEIAGRESDRQSDRATEGEIRHEPQGELWPELALGARPRSERLREDIAYWLECERYAPADGAPLDVLIERAQRCTTWLLRRLHDVAREETSLYAAAVAQAEALICALGDLGAAGDGRIGRITLEQLVDEVTGDSPDPATFAQAGHVRATTAAEAITRPWRTVIWWDLRAPGLRPGCPWSAAELAELAAEGVELPSADTQISARGRAWMRPVLNACSRLVLVLHDRDEGRHPLWSQIRSVARGFSEIRVEDALLLERDDRASMFEPARPTMSEPGGPAKPRPAGGMPGLGVATEPLAVRSLPGRRRWWKLPAGCALAPGPKESYTSLRQLIDYPHEWVLGYGARLSTGRAVNLARGALLYGNLAHRLFELYFEAFPGEAGGRAAWTALDREAAVRRFMAATLPGLIGREGAVLMEPGMGVLREQVSGVLEDALLRLLEHLAQAGICRVEAERSYEVPFEDVILRGAIDLLLTDARGREIVLDVKWGGEERRARELTANRHLQLATYAYMRRAGAARRAAAGAPRGGASGESVGPPWPEPAYFIVSTGNVLAHDTNVFPEALPFPPSVPERIDEVWARAAASLAWRSAQLAAGDVEVNAPGTEPDLRSRPPDDALAAAAEPDPFDVYTALTGWEPGA